MAAPTVQRWRGMSLRARIVGLVTLVVCGMAVPVLTRVPDELERISRGWIESRAVGIAGLLAAALAPAVEFEDREAAAALLRTLEATRGATWASLVGPGGRPLATWKTPPPLAPGPVPAGAQVSHAPGRLEVRVPVAARLSGVSTLVVGFDLAELRERLEATRGWLRFGSLLQIVVGAAAAFLVGTVLTRPLRRITRIADRITSGDLTAAAELDTRPRDEIGGLARAFDRTVSRLLDGQRELGAANAALSEKLEELRRTQEQLVVADRRVSVGRLSAGVAHEINNPLAYVASNLRYVARALPALAAGDAAQLERLPEVRQALADAQDGTERIKQIVKGLKGFSRTDDDRREVLDLAGPLESALAMGKHEIEQRASIVRALAPAPRVAAGEVRLTQVFLNLLVNAAHAIPEGDAAAHAVTVRTRTSEAGWAVVEVSDTGCGIPPEVQARLFEPFFTTKPKGLGTGLGLSISRDIVTSLGGRIELESAPGRGSTFRVLLPPAEAPAATPLPGRTAALPAVRTRLLVIDDEALVATGLARSLEGEVEVVVASRARDALDLLAADRFDHVLCDLMMPDMNGAQFHAEVTRRHPALAARLVFMTGGAFTPATERFLAEWRGPLLEKPVDVERLRKVVARAPRS
jgi:signal transduction histidine kinase